MLGQYAKAHNLSFEVKPLVPGVIGAKLYQFTQEACPFLHNNVCRVYPLRPLVCRMYPVHPYGIMQCTFLDNYAKLGHQVVFPENLKREATKYALTIQQIIQGADMVFSLDHGWKAKNRFPELRVSVT